MSAHSLALSIRGTTLSAKSYLDLDLSLTSALLAFALRASLRVSRTSIGMKICFRIPRAYLVVAAALAVVGTVSAVIGAFWMTVRVLESEPGSSNKHRTRTRIEPLP
jgi:hypothetical protein